MTPEQETLLLTVAGCLLAELRKHAEVPNPRITALAKALEPFEKVEVKKDESVESMQPVEKPVESPVGSPSWNER